MPEQRAFHDPFPYQEMDDEFGEPIVCESFVDDGLTRKCRRCGWWRTTHG